jgi:hypothetical protein
MTLLPFGRHARVYNSNNIADTKDNVATLKRARTQKQEIKALRKAGVLK